MAETPKYELVNAFDEIVKINVRDVQAMTDMCQCEKCFLDICAIVFNNRFSKFVTTRQGELLAKIPDMNQGKHTELIVAIAIAVEIVRKEPQHDN